MPQLQISEKTIACGGKSVPLRMVTDMSYLERSSYGVMAVFAFFVIAAAFGGIVLLTDGELGTKRKPLSDSIRFSLQMVTYACIGGACICALWPRRRVLVLHVLPDRRFHFDLSSKDQAAQVMADLRERGIKVRKEKRAFWFILWW